MMPAQPVRCVCENHPGRPNQSRNTSGRNHPVVTLAWGEETAGRSLTEAAGAPATPKTNTITTTPMEVQP